MYHLLTLLVGTILFVGGCVPQSSNESIPIVSTVRLGTLDTDTSLVRSLDEKVPLWLMESDVPSLAVTYIRDGSIEWTRVYGERADGIAATPRTLYNIASLTKPISAEIILRLASSGRLSLDESLSDYWIDPDIKDDPRHDELTLRLALSHQTGLPNWRYLTDAVLRFNADPGMQFGYSGEGYEYARRFTERKLGMPWESLAAEYVFSPIGMTNTSYTAQVWFANRLAIPYESANGFLDPSVQDSAVASDDVYTTIGDYADFLVSVMNREGLSAEIAKQRDSMHVAIPSATAECDAERAEYCPGRAGMGLGWEVLEFADGKALLHTGGDAGVQTMVVYFPERRNGAVMFTNGDQGFHVMLPTLNLMFRGTNLADFAMSKR
jgi:CubicO group peptidase (beta-lactamase class C family)